MHIQTYTTHHTRSISQSPATTVVHTPSLVCSCTVLGISMGRSSLKARHFSFSKYVCSQLHSSRYMLSAPGLSQLLCRPIPPLVRDALRICFSSLYRHTGLPQENERLGQLDAHSMKEVLYYCGLVMLLCCNNIISEYMAHVHSQSLIK